MLQKFTFTVSHNSSSVDILAKVNNKTVFKLFHDND